MLFTCHLRLWPPLAPTLGTSCTSCKDLAQPLCTDEKLRRAQLPLPQAPAGGAGWAGPHPTAHADGEVGQMLSTQVPLPHACPWFSSPSWPTRFCSVPTLCSSPMAQCL